ncbi:hypothetical protein DIPPA_31938 [Diplonema papillatum]|nr:hypothetical protein DIPPA_31938 [Diplonema papillatum]
MQSFFDDSLLGGQPGAERDVCEEPGSAEESARAPGGMQENKDRHLGGICEEACIANPPEHDQQILDGDVVMRESRNDGEPEAELVHREGPSSVAGQEGHGSGQLTSEMEVETHESVNKVGACMGTEDTEEQKIGDEEARDERSRVGAGPLEKRGEEEQAKDAPRETGGVGDRIAANGADALEKNAGTSDTTETLTGGNDKDKLPLGKTANEAGATSPAGETEFCYRSWLEEVAEAASRRLTIAGDVYAVDIVEDTPRLRPPTGHTSAHEVTALPNGLHMIPDFLSVAEERQLLEFFGTGSQWDTEDLKRRTAQYGYVFDYNTGHTLSAIPPSDRKARFPPLFWDGVLSKLKTAPGVPEDLRHLRDPDQCIVNQYVPGQGIGAHVDRVNLFDHSIVVVSLGSDAVMDFTKRTEHLRRVAIPRRSCYIMTGESRYDWQHALKPCSSDTYKGTHFERTVRISLTFRKVTETAKARCTGGILLQNMAYASEAELRGKLLATAAAAGEPEPAAQAFLTELLGHHPLEPLVRLGGLANIASRGPRRGGEGRSDGGRRRDSVQDSMREEVLAAHAQLNGGQTSRGAGPESVGTIDGRTEEVARGFLDSQDAATPGESCCETITNGRSEGTPTPRSKHVTATDVATDTQSDDPSGGAATPRADGLAAQEPASLFERDQPTIRSHATPVSSRRTSFSSNFSTTPRAHREPRRWQSQYDPDSETPVFTHEKQVGSTVVCTVSGSCASGGPFIWDGAEVVSALFEKGDHDEARRMPTPTAQGLPCAVLAGREFTERALQRHLEDMPNGTPSTADHFLLSALLLRHPAASFLTTAGVDEFSKTDGEFYVHSSRAEKPRRWQPNTSARLLFSRGGATAVGGKPYVNERALKKKEKKTRQHVQSPAPSPVSAPADVPEEPKTATANDAERVVEGETADATDEFVIRFGSEY